MFGLKTSSYDFMPPNAKLGTRVQNLDATNEKKKAIPTKKLFINKCAQQSENTA